MLTEDQEKALLLMLAEWQAGKNAQAQSLMDQKQTAEGQLRGLQPFLSAESAAVVEAELKPLAEAAVVLTR